MGEHRLPESVLVGLCGFCMTYTIPLEGDCPGGCGRRQRVRRMYLCATCDPTENMYVSKESFVERHAEAPNA